MKKIKLALIGIVCLTLFGYTSGCDQQNSNLHLPKEFEKMEQLLHDGLEYTFLRVSEYVRTNDSVTKDGMDSVTRAATLDFVATFDTNNMISNIVANQIAGKSPKRDTLESPELMAMLNEALNVIKSSPNGNLNQLSTKLGAINQKATANLSEKEAAAVYATTAVAYYATKYWSANIKKWKKLKENAKKKIKK
jgi:hypothetical protein